MEGRYNKHELQASSTLTFTLKTPEAHAVTPPVINQTINALIVIFALNRNHVSRSKDRIKKLSIQKGFQMFSV